jgi:hypothetical protein
MKIDIAACAAVAALSSLSMSVSAGNPHLNGNEAAPLHTGSVTVLFVDAEAPLDAYLRTGTNIPILLDGGAIGGAGVGVMDGIVDAHHRSKFLEAMQPYAPLIEKQHIPDQEYALAQAVFTGIPWLEKATWQHLPADTDRRRLLSSMKGLRTQAILVITPESMLRDDLNQVLVGYRVEIYTHDPYEDYGVKRLRDSETFSLWPEHPKDEFPPLDYRSYDSDDARTKNLTDYFADGGLRLGQELDGARSALKVQFNYFFTGVMPPAPATVSAPAPASTASPRVP